MPTPKKPKSANSIEFPYKPTEPQKQFAEAIAGGAKVVLFLGGIRSGKTFWSMVEGLKQIYLYKRKPNLGWIVSPTYKMSLAAERLFEKVSMMPNGQSLILKKLKGDKTYVMRPRKGETEFPNVEIRSADDPDHMRGPSVGWVVMDEASMMKPEAFDILLGRVLDSEGVIIMATTPRGKNWLYTRVYLKSLEDPRYVVIKCKTADNIHLPSEEVKELYAAYGSKSKALASQEMDADFCDFEGRVFTEFQPDTHVIPERDNPDGTYTICGVDFGYNDPFVCVFLQRRDGAWFVVDEYYKPKGLIREHAAWLKNHPLYSKVKRWWCDPSALQERKEFAAEGIRMFPARRPEHMKPLDWPTSRARLINSMFARRVQDPDEQFKQKVIPMLTYYDGIQNGLRETMALCYERFSEVVESQKDKSLYTRVTDKEGKELDKNAKEKIVDKDNHFVDALGYAIFSEVRPFGALSPHYYDPETGQNVKTEGQPKTKIEELNDLTNEFIENQARLGKKSKNIIDKFDTLG